MPEKNTEIEIALQMRSTAELDESIEGDLKQEDKSIASLLDDSEEDGTA